MLPSIFRFCRGKAQFVRALAKDFTELAAMVEARKHTAFPAAHALRSSPDFLSQVLLRPSLEFALLSQPLIKNRIGSHFLLHGLEWFILTRFPL